VVKLAAGHRVHRLAPGRSLAIAKGLMVGSSLNGAMSTRGYLTDVLARIVNGHPNRDIDQLLPWTYRKQELKAVA